MTQKTSVLFLIDSLATGGAERQLCELVKHMDRTRFEIHVAVFYPPGYFNGGELWPEIANLPDVALHCLHKRRGLPGYLTLLPKLLRLVLQTKAQILHGYIDGNLPLLLVGRLLRRRVVWGIRGTDKDHDKQPLRTRVLNSLGLRVARYVDLVIFNSESGKRHHEAIGMRARRMLVIHNGFDITRFGPNAPLGLAQRQAWGVPPDVPLIGIVGRLDPVKEHATFLRAAARIARDWPEARFVCIGGGDPTYLTSLQTLAADLGLQDRVLWPGISKSMVNAYNALSILVLTSNDEGFPNVLGEAMACGVPCVSTPAGDAALLIGDLGALAPIGDDAAIAEAIASLLRETPQARDQRSQATRTRICEAFSVQALARTTEDRMLELLT